MPESPSQKQIDQQQQRIESINDPERLKQKIEQNRNILIDAVDGAQNELSAASGNLESAAARDYLAKSSSSIGNYLRQIADHGYVVMQKHKANKEMQVEEGDLSRIGTLSSQLAGNLNDLKGGIESYRKIEAVKRDVDNAISDDDELDNSAGSADIGKLIENKKAINQRLESYLLLMPANPLTSSIKSQIETTIQTRQEKITADIQGLERANGFKTGVEQIAEKFPAIEEAISAYEKDPTDEKLSEVHAMMKSVVFSDLEEELNARNESEGLIKNVFNHLWSESYRPAKDRYEGLSKRLESKENEVVNKQAGLLLETVQKNWDAGIKGQWEKYDAMDYESKHQNKELEDILLRQLLATKGVLAKFASAEMNNKIEFSLYQQLVAKHEEMSGYVAKIEGFRISHANDVDMSKKGIRKYVRFGVREGEGIVNDQYYDFTPEFYKLSSEEQTRVRLLAEDISAKNLQFVRGKTSEIALESAGPQERIKILKERMGSKGASYFEGLEKLQSGDPEAAVNAFNQYISQSFNSEEQELHKDTISDAKEKLKGIMEEKLKVLDGLFGDVKELAYARSKMGGNPELKVDEGYEADAITTELEAFRQDIADGKVTDFDKRYSEFKNRIREAVTKKQKKETDLLMLLDQLHQVSREKDPEKRKAGFTDFAQRARDSQAYKLAMKYLDYALENDLDEASKHVSKADVLKKMMSEPEFVSKLNEQAQQQMELILKEHPDLRGQLTMERVKQNLLNRALDDRYTRELRRYITPADGLMNDPALAKYNNWFPIDDPKWYKPWDYGAEEWDDFQMECIKFVWENVPSLGIGLAASAAGQAGAKIGGRLFLRYLARKGLTQAEISLVEQGGIKGLVAAMQSGRQFSFAASRLVGTIAAEGTTMYTMGLGMEYLQTGELASIKKSPGRGIAVGLAQSMAQASLFRLMGLGLSAGPLHAEMQKGLIRGTAAWLASETISGVGGAGIEYGFAKMQGHEFTGQDAFKSVMSNYLMSVGMHALDSAPRSSKADKAMEDEMANWAKSHTNESESLSNVPDKNENRSKRRVDDADDIVPEPMRDDGRHTFFEDATNAEPALHRENSGSSPKEHASNAEPDISAPKPADGLMFDRTNAAIPNAKRASEASKSTSPRERTATTPEITSAQLAAERGHALDLLRQRYTETPELEIKINDIIKERGLDPDLVNQLEPAEIRLLAESDPQFLKSEIVEQILRKQYDVIQDNVNGEWVTVRYYIDGSANANNVLGEGGLGLVREGYFVVWDKNGVTTASPQLRMGAVKEVILSKGSFLQNHPMMTHELDTLRSIRDSGQDAYDTGFINPLFAGRRAIRDAEGNILRYDNVTITEKIEKYDFADSPTLMSMIGRAQPEDTIGLLSKALRGVREMHRMGRMHWDIKPENFFVGRVNGRDVAVLGDLAGIPVAELRNIDIKKYMDEGTQYVNAHYGGTIYGVPNTRSCFRVAYRHLRIQQEWMKANPEATTAPQHIIALTDIALIGKTVTELRSFYRKHSDMLPHDVANSVDKQLSKLASEIGRVPDMDKLNKAIAEAGARGDSEALAKAIRAKEEALRGMENFITVEQIQTRLNTISAEIRSARPADSVPHPTTDINPTNVDVNMPESVRPTEAAPIGHAPTEVAPTVASSDHRAASHVEAHNLSPAEKYIGIRTEADRAFRESCLAEIDKGGENFMRWRESITDPRQFAMAEKVRAVEVAKSLHAVKQELAGVDNIFDAERVINEYNNNADILPGTEWRIVKVFDDGGAVVLGTDGRLSSFHDSPQQYDFAAFSRNLKRDLQKWDRMAPVPRNRRIASEVSVAREKLSKGHIPDEVRMRILKKAGPEVSAIINSPSPEAIARLTQPQIQKLRMSVLEIRNADFRVQRAHAREKAVATTQLADQIENVMRDQLANNPAITRQQLYELINLENNPAYSEAGFTPMEKQKMRYVVDTLFEKAKAVKEYSRRFESNPEALYEEVFGVKPDGEVEIGTTTFSLYFVCKDVNDFSRISGSTSANGEAVPMGRTKVDSLDGSIVVIRGDSSNNRDIVIHEDQHNINKYVLRALQPHYDSVPQLAVDSSLPEAQQKGQIKEHLDSKLEGDLVLARDEILAYMKQGESIRQIRSRLLRDGGIYDFFGENQTAYIDDSVRGQSADLRYEVGSMVEDYNARYRDTIGAAINAAERIGDFHTLMTNDIRHWQYLGNRRGSPN